MSEASRKYEDQIWLGFDALTSSPESAGGTSPSGSPGGTTSATGKSGPGAAPANRSRRPGRAKALPTSATSGPSSSGSSLSADQQQSWVSRWLQRLASRGSMEYSLTLKERVSPAGRRIPALRASARRTSDKDFTGWPTAQAHKNTESGPLTNKDGTPWDGHSKPWQNGRPVTTALTDVAQLAGLSGWDKTPQASDGDGGVMEIRPGTTGKYKLRDYAQLAGWPTSKMTDCHGSKPHGQGGQGLHTMAQSALGPTTELFRVQTGRRAALAPEFSLWLMGFPEEWAASAPGARDWQEAQAALALECSKDQGTP